MDSHQDCFYELRCQNSFLQVNDREKLCGTVKTSIIYEGRSDDFKLSLNVGSQQSSFKLYYEGESRETYFVIMKPCSLKTRLLGKKSR